MNWNQWSFIIHTLYWWPSLFNRSITLFIIHPIQHTHSTFDLIESISTIKFQQKNNHHETQMTQNHQRFYRNLFFPLNCIFRSYISILFRFVSFRLKFQVSFHKKFPIFTISQFFSSHTVSFAALILIFSF